MTNKLGTLYQVTLRSIVEDTHRVRAKNETEAREKAISNYWSGIKPWESIIDDQAQPEIIIAEEYGAKIYYHDDNGIAYFSTWGNELCICSQDKEGIPMFDTSAPISVLTEPLDSDEEAKIRKFLQA